MKGFRRTEEAALSNVTRGTPKPPIDEADLAMNAALEGTEHWPSNVSKPPVLSRIAALFGKGGCSDMAGDGG